MNSKFTKKEKLSFGAVLYWITGILLIITMLSTWLLSSLFAKYAVYADANDAANVANGGYFVLLEHKAKPVQSDEYELEYNEENGFYELDPANYIYVLDDEEEFEENIYENVMPGVDIPKDPLIRLSLENSEVDYQLYVQVVKSIYFPDTVTFKLTDEWEEFDKAKGIYKYKGYFDAGTAYTDDIKILKDDKLEVSEHYVGKDKNGNDLEFALTFNVWLKQVD